MKAKINLLHLAEWLCRWGIGTVFIIAAVPKIFHPGDFAAIVGAYGLLPDGLVVPVAFILPPLELAVAVGLTAKRWWGRLGIGLFLLFFILVLAYGIHLGLDIDCGCFGPEDPEHEAFSGLRTALWRDILMFLLLVFSSWVAGRQDRIRDSGHIIQ